MLASLVYKPPECFCFSPVPAVPPNGDCEFLGTDVVVEQLVSLKSAMLYLSRLVGSSLTLFVDHQLSVGAHEGEAGSEKALEPVNSVCFPVPPPVERPVQVSLTGAQLVLSLVQKSLGQSPHPHEKSPATEGFR